MRTMTPGVRAQVKNCINLSLVPLRPPLFILVHTADIANQSQSLLNMPSQAAITNLSELALEVTIIAIPVAKGHTGR